MTLPGGFGVVAYSYYYLEDTQFSPQAVYESLEQAYDSKKIPNVETKYVEHKEGGLMSPKKKYFRVSGHGEYYDIGALPYGDDFIISIRHCCSGTTATGGVFSKQDILNGFHDAVMRVFTKTVDELTSGKGVIAMAEIE